MHELKEIKKNMNSFLPLFLYNTNKKERISFNYMEKLVPFLIFFLGLTTIFSLFLYSSNPLTPISKLGGQTYQNILRIKTKKECDIFKGNWVQDLKGSSSSYTNSSCATIPNSKNCFFHGRKDRDFLNWRWKPEKCDLSSFDAKVFLDIVRGKTLAFVGDSVARNHMESLLCLLSQEEAPVDVYQDSEDRNRIWRFSTHEFTLKSLWTKFFVEGKERMINGSASGVFDLYLDKLDSNWIRDLHTVDYIVISNGHWFFRPIYLYNGSDTVSCVYCNDRNVSDKGVDFAVKMAFRAALDHINQGKTTWKGIVTLLRTFSPSHFENGYWNTGGNCNRTGPYSEKEVELTDLEDWRVRNVQVGEIDRVRKEGKKGRVFEILDVTRAMLMRPDGHPGTYWGNQWMKGYNDCVHWCLPGPIDVWNDLLLAVLKRQGLFF